MRETEAIIERVWRIAPDVQRLELRTDEALRHLEAGQSLLAAGSSYLREQWLPVEVGQNTLTVERPMTSTYAPGQTVSLLGPVGNKFPWNHQKRLLLIAYDTYPTPLLMLAHKALRQNAAVAFILLGKARDYPVAGMPAAVEVIPGHDTAVWPDRDATLLWADQIFAVANDAFSQEHFSELFQMTKNLKMNLPMNTFYGVMTPLQPCGTGACMACMIRGKTSNKLVCVDGPAFDLTEIFLV